MQITGPGNTTPINPDYRHFSTITPTQHEKNEWSRMAQSAYAATKNDVGHRYSAAASLPSDGRLRLAHFDWLQAGYRHWLISGQLPVVDIAY